MKKEANRNCTLSLPVPLLRKFKVYAAESNQSMSALVTKAIEKMIESDSAIEKANERLIKRMRNARDLGTGGKITWKREDLYDRGVR